MPSALNSQSPSLTRLAQDAAFETGEKSDSFPYSDSGIFAYPVHGRFTRSLPTFLEVAAICFEKVLTFFAKTI